MKEEFERVKACLRVDRPEKLVLDQRTNAIKYRSKAVCYVKNNKGTYLCFPKRYDVDVENSEEAKDYYKVKADNLFNGFEDVIQKICDVIDEQSGVIMTYGCCGLYMECSNAKKCVQKDIEWSKGCQYKQNLENGRIFYGENRNIE